MHQLKYSTKPTLIVISKWSEPVDNWMQHEVLYFILDLTYCQLSFESVFLLLISFFEWKGSSVSRASTNQQISVQQYICDMLNYIWNTFYINCVYVLFRVVIISHLNVCKY